MEDSMCIIAQETNVNLNNNKLKHMSHGVANTTERLNEKLFQTLVDELTQLDRVIYLESERLFTEHLAATPACVGQ